MTSPLDEHPVRGDLGLVRPVVPIHGGRAMARVGKVVFVDGALPGELVEVRVTKVKRDFVEAETVRILEPSPHRRPADCPLFGDCGGCTWLDVDYDHQLALKGSILTSALARIAKMEVPIDQVLADADRGYRHRAQLGITSRGRPGYRRRRSHEVLPVPRCPLLSDGINETLEQLGEAPLHGVERLTLVEGDVVVAHLEGRGTTARSLPVGSGNLAGAQGQGWYEGRRRITIDLGQSQYQVSPTTFFQAHTALNRRVVAAVVEHVAQAPDGPLVDLYAGAGNFSIPLALAGRSVIAVESHPGAVEDGRHNATELGLHGLTMAQADVDTWLRVDAPSSPFAACVVDPPRAGLSAAVRAYLEAQGPPVVVYVSCDPATFARDLGALSGAYSLCHLSLIDFFPATPHLEAMACLTRRH